MLIRILLLVALTTTMAWAGDDHGHEEEEEEGGHESEEIVKFSDAEMDEFAIETAVAGPGLITTHLELPGEVRPNADRVAHIVPRYEGIVTDVRVHEGDEVTVGQVLAIVEGDASLAPFPVKTLIGGTVIAKHVALGEAIRRDRSAFVVADLSTVWIDLTVYQRDLQHLEVGQTVQVVIGHDVAAELATIEYITPVVDEDTRTATARLVINNDERFWRPGMFVTADVLIAEVEAKVTVPLTALQDFEGGVVVFISTHDGFVPRGVRLGQRDNDNVEILSGLSIGETYVSDGGFTIKAELGKESFGGGHSH